MIQNNNRKHLIDHLNYANPYLVDEGIELQPNIEAIIDWDNVIFQQFLKKFPVEEYSTIEQRLRYIRNYCCKHPMFNGDDFQPLNAPYSHYLHRDMHLSKVHFSEEDYYNFKPLQTAISKLGLDPVSLFDFLVFIYNLTVVWSENQYQTTGEVLHNALSTIENNPEVKTDLTITVGCKPKLKVSINDSLFIEAMLDYYLKEDKLSLGTMLPQKGRTERFQSYILVKTLLDNLPITYTKKNDQLFTQAERTFGLSILYFCRFLVLTKEQIKNHIKIEDLCSKDYNATFDNLMRTFKSESIPIHEQLI